VSELRAAAHALLNALAPLPVGSGGVVGAAFDRLSKALAAPDEPMPMRLRCPDCGELHVDVGEFFTKLHHTHSCQKCGETWRPAVAHTVGVQFLPGFKNGVDP
jgi:predicted RNA-binding Zn-ribbon protein involved in translation (DUF1610 family)